MIAQQTVRPAVIRQTKHGHTLFWKEIWENKMLALWPPVILIAAIVAIGGANLVGGYYHNGKLYDSEGLSSLLMVMWLFSGVLTSSSMMSPEIGGSSLQFLSSLPMTRRRIWWTKLAAQLLINCVSIVLTTIAYTLIYVLAAKSNLFIDKYPIRNLSGFFRDAGFLPAFSFAVFSVGSLVTMFTDRTISTFFVATIISVLIASGLIGLAALLTPDHRWLVWTLLTIGAAAMLYMSHEVFVRGETLKTSKRFKVLLEIARDDVVPIAAALVISMIWIMH